MAATKCLNCGCAIGSLETPHVWNGHVVCRGCYAKLRPRRGTRRWVWFGTACVCVATVGSVAFVWFTNMRASSSGDAPIGVNSDRTAIAPSLVAAPPQPPKVGAISGTAWLNRRDGSSDIQRGLTVSVIKGTVIRDVVLTCLRTELSALEKSAADFSAIGSDSADNEAENARRRVAEAQRTMEQLSPLLDVGHVHSLLIKLAPFGRYGVRLFSSEVVAASLVKCVRTGADGRYVIEGIAPGDYFLHALIETDAIFVEWLVPVHVEAATSTNVDLFNDNAAVSW